MLGVRLAFQEFAGERAPYAFNFLAVVLAALLAGWRSGLIALFLGQLLIWYVVLSPHWGFEPPGGPRLGGFVIATFSQLLVLAVIALYQREIDKAVAEGLPGRWLDPVEDLSLRGFTRQAHYADLVIVGQYPADDDGAAGVPADFVETVMMDSGRPVLAIPYIGVRMPPGDVILVAWKESRETARAVAAALPQLKAAKRVHVVTWMDEASGPGRRYSRLGEQLRRHGVEAQLHNYGAEPGDVGGYMLSAAADLGADMIVMGGYGTSRAREWVLGGATRTILRSMTVPVLMVH